MSSLATITQTLDLLCNEIEDKDGDIPPDLLERFHGLKASHEEKLAAYVAVMDAIKMQSDFYESRANKLRAKVKTSERVLAKMKERILWNIQNAPNLPWKSSEGDKFAVKANPPSVFCDLATTKLSLSNVIPKDSIEGIPKKYVDIVTAHCLNMDAVKQDLLEGVELEFAKLKNGSHLRIY